MADKPFTAAQVNLLHTFIDFLAIQIVNARLLDERALARVTRRELQIAADIQRSLLPAKIPACPPFELAAACQSAQQVGGSLGLAILATLSVDHTTGLLKHGAAVSAASRVAATVSGYHVAFLAAAIMMGAGAVLMVLFLRRRHIEGLEFAPSAITAAA